MTDAIVSSLTALPFDHILSAPLTAAIRAQAQAAITTVQFINNVGFVADDTNPTPSARMVAFTYTRTNAAGTQETVTLSVPLLTIVPIPYIRISDMSIDFEMKVHQVQESDRTDQKNIDLKVSGSAGFAWFKTEANLQVTVSNKSSSKSQDDRSATLRITVRAVQDEIPNGLAQVLTLLRDGIQPVKTGP